MIYNAASCSSANFMNIKRRGESACSSPSFFFNVTNVVSRHRGRAHVADEGKKLVAWKKINARRCKVKCRICDQIEYSSQFTTIESYLVVHITLTLSANLQEGIKTPDVHQGALQHVSAKKKCSLLQSLKLKSGSVNLKSLNAGSYSSYLPRLLLHAVSMLCATHSLSHLTREQARRETRRKRAWLPSSVRR